MNDSVFSSGRFKNTTIVTESFNMECQGKGTSRVLEDEMFMRSIHMLAIDIGCEWFDVPVQKWPLSLDLAFDVTYPVMRYRNADSAWKGKTRGYLGCANKAR